jgi:hypothetical protein
MRLTFYHGGNGDRCISEIELGISILFKLALLVLGHLCLMAQFEPYLKLYLPQSGTSLDALVLNESDNRFQAK